MISFKKDGSIMLDNEKVGFLWKGEGGFFYHKPNWSFVLYDSNFYLAYKNKRKAKISVKKELTRPSK